MYTHKSMLLLLLLVAAAALLGGHGVSSSSSSSKTRWQQQQQQQQRRKQQQQQRRRRIEAAAASSASASTGANSGNTVVMREIDLQGRFLQDNTTGEVSTTNLEDLVTTTTNIENGDVSTTTTTTTMMEEEEEVVPTETPTYCDISIVGAGISGLYAAWRLLSAKEPTEIFQDHITAPYTDIDIDIFSGVDTPPDYNISVCIYEMSNRVGGRLVSIKPPMEYQLQEEGEGGGGGEAEEFIAEFGDFHFPDYDDMDHLTKYVINYFDIPLTDSNYDYYHYSSRGGGGGGGDGYGGDGHGDYNNNNNLLYLRGKHLHERDIIMKKERMHDDNDASDDDDDDSTIYKLNWLEKQYKHPLLILYNAIEMIVPNAHSLNETEWDFVKEEGTFDNIPLHKQSLWNVLSQVISNEAYEYIKSYIGLDHKMENVNSAQGLHQLVRSYNYNNNNPQDNMNVEYKTPVNGMESIALILRNEIEKLGGKFVYKHELIDFDLMMMPTTALEEEEEDDEEIAEDVPPLEDIPGNITLYPVYTMKFHKHVKQQMTMEEEQQQDGEEEDEITNSMNEMNSTNTTRAIMAYTRHMILAIPPNSLRNLHSYQNNNKLPIEVKTLINSVESIPNIKLYLCYDYPWWKTKTMNTREGNGGNGRNNGRSVTDSVLRQTFYFDNTNCILATYSDGKNHLYWQALEKAKNGYNKKKESSSSSSQEEEEEKEENNNKNNNNNMMKKKSSSLSWMLNFNNNINLQNRWMEITPNIELIMEIQRHLKILHNMKYIPQPKSAAYINWSDRDGGCSGVSHVWKVTDVPSEEITEAILKPLDNIPIYIIGQAYSQKQGIIEGDFETAETLLQTHFFTNSVETKEEGEGEWDPVGHEILGHEDGTRIGKKISASADGSRIALVSTPPPPPPAATNNNDAAFSRSFHNEQPRGHVQVYEYIGYKEAGMWDLMEFDIFQHNEEFIGGTEYSVALSGDGLRLAVGVIMSIDGNQTIPIVPDVPGDDIGQGDDDDQEETLAGYVQVFEFNEMLKSWIKLGSIITSGMTNDYFGFSLDLNFNGTILAIGAPNHENNMGMVQTFKLSSSSPSQEQEQEQQEVQQEQLQQEQLQQREEQQQQMMEEGGREYIQYGNFLYGNTPGDLFGWSISLNNDGNLLGIGSPWSFDKSGLVQIYKMTHHDERRKLGVVPGGGRRRRRLQQQQQQQEEVVELEEHLWIQHGQDIIPPLLQDDEGGEEKSQQSSFGQAIALSGNGEYIAIGAPSEKPDVGPQGIASVYKYDVVVSVSDSPDAPSSSGADSSSSSISSGNWTLYGTPISGDNVGDLAGFDVDISHDGQKLIVGAPGSVSPDATQTGYVRVFEMMTEKKKNTNNIIMEQGEEEEEDDGENDSSNSTSTATEDSTNNTTNAIAINDNDDDDDDAVVADWIQIGSNITGEMGDAMGWSVFISNDGSDIIVGAPSDSDDGRGYVRSYTYVSAPAVEEEEDDDDDDDMLMSNETDSTTTTTITDNNNNNIMTPPIIPDPTKPPPPDLINDENMTNTVSPPIINDENMTANENGTTTDAETTTTTPPIASSINGYNAISIKLVHNDRGWLGLGISSSENTNENLMVGSEAVIGLPNENSVLKYELNDQQIDDINESVIPMENEAQTLINTNIEQDQETILSYTKYLNEDGELSINPYNGPNTFIYAFGSNGNNELRYHTPDNRGSFTVDFSTCSDGFVNPLLVQCASSTDPNYDHEIGITNDLFFFYKFITVDEEGRDGDGDGDGGDVVEGLVASPEVPGEIGEEEEEEDDGMMRRLTNMKKRHFLLRRK